MCLPHLLIQAAAAENMYDDLDRIIQTAYLRASTRECLWAGVEVRRARLFQEMSENCPTVDCFGMVETNSLRVH